MSAARLVAFILCVPLFALAPNVCAFDSSDCADCHAEVDEDTPLVTEAMLEGSVHEGFDCTDCHEGIDDLPHEEALAAVSCGSCHDEEAEVYRRHGRASVDQDPDTPNCADCHGTHEVFHSSDRRSMVSPLNLPATCGRCHEDIDLAKRHQIMLKGPVKVFETSVHGKATIGGSVDFAATCNDCHSTNGTAHRIFGPGDPTSAVNHFNVPRTCGKCHHTIEQEYWEGIHGVLAARGETDTPVCTTCHGEHGILPARDPRANVSPTMVAEATCAPCHESARLNEKYGLPAGRLASFIDSYHGLKSKAGDTTVANCSSCHGAHYILPSSDERSSIHLSNLRDTCGHCHPGISEVMATSAIHATGTGRRTGWSQFFTVVYVILISLTVGFMLFHCTIDFVRQAHALRSSAQVKRMNGNAVAQHTVLTVSFLLLVLTGFALSYSEAWIFRMLFGWDGGFQVRGIAHRASAILFVIGVLWHLLYLLTAHGRQFVRDMMPKPSDARDLARMISFNLGRAKTRPRFGRFSYGEKLEYWALVWGSVIMIGTGFLLWFDNAAVAIVSKGFLDVMLVIHFYEAVLASLAIAVWHLYGTVFNPSVYPGNPAWITGKMPEKLYRHEHPAAPLPSGGSGD